MEAKKYLRQLSSINDKISYRLEQIGVLRGLLGANSQNIKSDCVMSSPNQDKLEAFVVKICDLEKEINDLIELKFEIMKTVESIESPRTYKIIYLKYVNELSVNEICDEVDLARRTVFAEIQQGIEEVQHILDNRTN